MATFHFLDWFWLLAFIALMIGSGVRFYLSLANIKTVRHYQKHFVDFYIQFTRCCSLKRK